MSLSLASGMLFTQSLRTPVNVFFSEEDVSETLYKDTLKAPKADITQPGLVAPSPSKGSKVNRICDAFLSTLEKRLDTNLHNLITAHVCKSPPDLESGLQLVARLRGSYGTLVMSNDILTSCRTIARTGR